MFHSQMVVKIRYRDQWQEIIYPLQNGQREKILDQWISYQSFIQHLSLDPFLLKNDASEIYFELLLLCKVT